MLSVIFAVLAAAGNAVASVLQRSAARKYQNSDDRGIRLVWHLLHRPPWLGGIAAMMIGFVFQVLALATGPIIVVQPILVLELGFTLLLTTVVFGTRLGRPEWVAVAGMSVGLALLLAGLYPTGGNAGSASALGWTIGSAVTLAVVGVLLVLAHRGEHDRKTAYFGAATGIMFGFTAVLVAGATQSVHGGLPGLFTTWQVWGVVVVGPASFFLLQRTLESGRLVAAQPPMTLANPLVAVAWGLLVFGEQARSGGWIAADLIGAGLVTVSTVALARSALFHDAGHRRDADSQDAPRTARNTGNRQAR